jgi:hypothetical protein
MEQTRTINKGKKSKPPRRADGFKKKYRRKKRRSVIDFVEKKELIEFMYVRYGSRVRGMLMPGSQIPRPTDDPKTMTSVKQAAGLTGIKYNTAWRIHSQYIDGGFKFLETNEAMRIKRRKKLQGLERYLMKYLEDWNQLPLTRRVEIIREDFGDTRKVSAKTLSSFYKYELNIRYRRPCYHISNKYTDV